MSDKEHIRQLNDADRRRLQKFLERPNGSLTLGRPGAQVTFEAVGGGGVLVRTSPYRYVAPEPRVRK